MTYAAAQYTQVRTLQQAILHFSDEQVCIDAVVAMRWPDGKPVCPGCGNKDHYWLASQKRWKCKECWKQFSVKVGTIFEDSPIPLTKWMLAMWMIGGCKNGVSSWEIHRAIGVTQKSAWFMMHRIRLAMHSGSLEVKLGGEGKTVEVDETFIGGKARNMHKSKRERVIYGRGTAGKVVVMGTLQRGDGSSASQVKAQVVENRHVDTLQGAVKKNVAKGSTLYSDEFSAYAGLENEYDHEVINHAVEYVQGLVHTQGMENFWSLLKRGLGGTYVSVEPFHLFRYIDEQAFRFNNRGHKKNPVHDGQRFQMILSNVAGRRVMYKELTGKTRLPAEGAF
jgi:transposase-like protein